MLPMGEDPIRSKSSQQAGSEIHVQTQQREYGAGWNKDTGCVIEPRKGYRCGRKISILEREYVKADGFRALEGRSPGDEKKGRVDRTPLVIHGRADDRKPLDTEEPDERIVHVRICGGRGG